MFHPKERQLLKRFAAAYDVEVRFWHTNNTIRNNILAQFSNCRRAPMAIYTKEQQKILNW